MRRPVLWWLALAAGVLLVQPALLPTPPGQVQVALDAALQAELAALVLERGASRVVFSVVLAQPSRLGAADDGVFRRRLAPWWSQLVLAAASTGSSQQDL